MAGSGKGVLRIAIEDFLESFDPSNWYENIFGNFGAFMLDNVLGRYVSILDDIAAVSDIPALKEISATHSTNANKFEKFLLLLSVIGAIVTSFGGAFFKPSGDIVTYAMQRKILSGRLTIPHLIELLGKDPSLYDKYSGDGLDQGFDANRIMAMNTAQLAELDLGLTVSLYRRQIINDNELGLRLRALHIKPERVSDLLKGTEVIPGAQDLIRMAVREAFSPDIVTKFQYGEAFPQDVLEHTRKIGLTDDWVKRYWYAHWELPSPNAGYEMLHRLRPGRGDIQFTKDDLDLLLRTADYAPYFRDKLVAIAYQPVTRVDIRRMYRLGIYDEAEVKQRYMDIGYTEKDAESLTEFTVKYEDANGGSNQDAIDNLTASLAKAMYKKGIITKDDYKARLTKLKYASDIADLVIKLADEELAESLVPDFRKDFINDMLNDIEKAYAARMTDETTARSGLSALGISSSNIDYIIKKEDYKASLDDLNASLKLVVDSYLSGSITRDYFIGKLGELGISGAQQNKVIAGVEQQLTFRSRRLTEAQYRTATTRGLISEADYRAAMIGLGYSDYDIDLLIALYLTPGGTTA